MRNTSLLIFAVLLTGTLASSVEAQSVPIQSPSIPLSSAVGETAASPGQQDGSDSVPAMRDQAAAESTSRGTITGTVTAPDGNVLVGAQVTLVDTTSKSQRTLLTDSDGAFSFTGLEAGTFQLTITSNGFAAWAGPEIVLASAATYQQPQIMLQIASTNTTVNAVFTGQDLAQQQMKAEEKQRVLGVLPNFYTSYIWNAEPLSSGEKFQLALRTSIDPVTFLGTGAIAGIQQWKNDFKEYGQGFQGYVKRYGASYTTSFSDTLIGGAILPAILHQDPRYFYKGTGTILSRALYAISTVVICKGDNGRWQPNYSNVLGNLAAGGISNIYYPPADRGFEVTIDNALLDTAGGAASSLLQEFLLRRISRGVPLATNTQP